MAILVTADPVVGSAWLVRPDRQSALAKRLRNEPGQYSRAARLSRRAARLVVGKLGSAAAARAMQRLCHYSPSTLPRFP